MSLFFVTFIRKITINIIFDKNLQDVIFIVIIKKKWGKNTIYCIISLIILRPAHKLLYFIKDFFKIIDDTLMILKKKKTRSQKAQ